MFWQYNSVILHSPIRSSFFGHLNNPHITSTLYSWCIILENILVIKNQLFGLIVIWLSLSGARTQRCFWSILCLCNFYFGLLHNYYPVTTDNPITKVIRKLDLFIVINLCLRQHCASLHKAMFSLYCIVFY